MRALRPSGAVGSASLGAAARARRGATAPSSCRTPSGERESSYRHGSAAGATASARRRVAGASAMTGGNRQRAPATSSRRRRRVMYRQTGSVPRERIPLLMTTSSGKTPRTCAGASGLPHNPRLSRPAHCLGQPAALGGRSSLLLQSRSRSGCGVQLPPACLIGRHSRPATGASGAR